MELIGEKEECENYVHQNRNRGCVGILNLYLLLFLLTEKGRFFLKDHYGRFLPREDKKIFEAALWETLKKE